MSGTTTLDRAARVREILAGVMDPEIPVVSVLDLGIVREIAPDGRSVAITPTYSGCPATAAIEAEIKRSLAAADLADVTLVTRLDPPWTTDWITPEGRAKLAAWGIAPPSPRAAATCPHCGADDTVEVSRFGSTPCKALWRCRACGEPFDRFKCH
ncbi:MAG: 1,2-phenylacetyl-CoA epoxidase subunit PaaD [Caulobacteraceae bacterium]